MATHALTNLLADPSCHQLFWIVWFRSGFPSFGRSLSKRDNTQFMILSNELSFLPVQRSSVSTACSTKEWMRSTKPSHRRF